MENPKKASTYRRAPESRGANVPYEQKFANLIDLCEHAKADGIENVIVTWPWVIGDTYEEIIESLSRLADARLSLHIVQSDDRDKIHLPKASLN